MEEKAMYCRSTIRPDNPNRVRMTEDALEITGRDGEAERVPFTEGLRPTDPEATKGAVRLCRFLDGMGRSSRVMYGQQNPLMNRAGSYLEAHSDICAVTGAHPGVFGLDVLALTGVEFSAKRWNADYTAQAPGWPGGEQVDIERLGIGRADVLAAAKLTRIAQELGCIVTLSAHMPNFVFTKPNALFREGIEPEYARYDFKEYTPNNCEGGTVQEILQGGKARKVMQAYLDLVAEYAQLVEGPILFRPLHENTGGWFWWGDTHCTPEEFRELYRTIVRYLRDEKQVHNLLYAYSPGSEPRSVEEFDERYPGDEWVDLLGFDMYDRDTDTTGDPGIFPAKFAEQIRITQDAADRHGKLFAVTETGLVGDPPDEGCKATAVRLTGNKNPGWYRDIMGEVAQSRASYFLLWANFGKKRTFYAPFVEEKCADGTLYGHELLDGFIAYYNDPRSIFSEQQKEVRF
jgi:mannan endo-1,4-beta-mannosidase